MTDLLVRRDDLRVWQAVDGDASEAAGPGELRLRVERFGLTANNVTYGLLGDRLDYWKFFAAPEGWGRIPVWGFGEVTASGVDGIAAGDRFYGCLPMSSAVTLRARTRPDGFAERSSARAALQAIYNRYLAATPEQGFLPAHDDANVVVRPLFMTGWLIADHLEQAGWYEAEAVVLASASSKTAFSTAFELARRDERPEIVGLTSPANRAFTEGLGCYDRVLTYDALASLSVDGGIVFVDMAGAPALRRAVHEHAADALRASFMVGATHWESASFAGDPLPGPTPESSHGRARRAARAPTGPRRVPPAPGRRVGGVRGPRSAAARDRDRRRRRSARPDLRGLARRHRGPPQGLRLHAVAQSVGSRITRPVKRARINIGCGSSHRGPSVEKHHSGQAGGSADSFVGGTAARPRR